MFNLNNYIISRRISADNADVLTTYSTECLIGYLPLIVSFKKKQSLVYTFLYTYRLFIIGGITLLFAL